MKKRTFQTLGYAILLLTGLRSGVWAGLDYRSHRLSLNAGAGLPTGSNHFSDSAKMGAEGGLQYLHFSDNHWASGVQIDAYRFGEKDHTLTSDAGGQISARSEADAATVEYVGRYSFTPEARMTPYLTTGIGLNTFHQKTDGEPKASYTWTDTNTAERRQLEDSRTIGFSFSLGLGLEASLTQNWVLGLESAWHVLGVSKSTYGTSALGMGSVSLRLGWRFAAQPFDAQ